MGKTCAIVFDDMFNDSNVKKTLNKPTCETEESSSLTKIFDCLGTSNFL